jgi:hypothetical protein
MKLYSLTGIFFMCLLNIGIRGQCVKEVNSFQPGEKLYYDAYYNWGFIWIHAGDLSFTVSNKEYKSKQVYFFEALGNSLKSYDWIYKVRDTFQTHLEISNFRPLWFKRNTYEGGSKVYEQYTFNHNNNKIYSLIENSKHPLRKDSVQSKACTFDVLSAIYFCRTMPIEKYKIDEKIPLSTVIDNTIYSLYLRYKGRETIKTRDNKYYKCIKFSALLVEGTIFKGGEDMYIWVTDDDNRIPVLVEAKILIGSVKAYLVKTQGIKYPLTSLVAR